MPAKVSKAFIKMMAGRFATLGDSTRLEIIHCLMKEGEQNVTRLVEATGQSYQNISKHLRHLREAKILARRKEGLHVFYRLEDPLVERLCELVCESLATEFGKERRQK